MTFEDVKKAMLNDIHLSNEIRQWLRSDAELFNGDKCILGGCTVAECLSHIAYLGGSAYNRDLRIEEV
jgi:hypothetical protein